MFQKKRFNGLYTPLVDVYILKVALLRAADTLYFIIKRGDRLIVPKSVF